MEDLLRYEKQVQTFLHEGNPPGVLPFPNNLESESFESELWSRVHLSYVISLNLGGRGDTAAITQWANTRTAVLMQYVPRKTWFLSQTELEELKQKLILRMQGCQYELDFQLNGIITPLTLFCKAFLCAVCKDKELFDEKLLPADVTWPEYVTKYYSPIWQEGIEFVCTKITNENLLPTSLHILSEVSVMFKHFVKLSANQVTQEDCAWLYGPQQLKKVLSCCEDAISSYFNNTCKLQLCEELNQMLSIESVSSVTQQVNDCVNGGKVVIQSCWKLCDDIGHVISMLSGGCPLTEHLQSLCTDVINHATSTCFQELSEWCSTDAPKRLPYYSWYIVLSSLLHMAGRLRHYVTHNVVHDVATALQECSKLVDRIQSDIVNYHVELCRNGLLHDGRSHHWQDSRPFYEGERCSFSIQMWAYHLKAFKHDLWRVFAFDVAARLLGAVLVEGLIIISQRCNTVKPSMRRLPQMKADILMVLLTAASLLPNLFPLPCVHTHHLYVTSCVINSCCMSLLRDLTLVCADLTAIMDGVMEIAVTTNGLRSGLNDSNSEWLGHVLLGCHVEPTPLTYTVGCCTADGANQLLHLCGLSTVNEQLLIKILVANNFLLGKGLIKGGAGVLPELAYVLYHCSHTPDGLCTVLEQAGNKECIDWLKSYLQPHLLWCMLPKAMLFTRWMAKFMYNEVIINDNEINRKTLVEIFSGALKRISDLLLSLPSSVCLFMSRLSPVSTLLSGLLCSMFPQSHNQLFYSFASIVAGLLDNSMLFEAPANIVDILSLCKADFVPIITALNDASMVTNHIHNNALPDDSEHMIVVKLLKETDKGRKSLEILYNAIVSNQEALFQWCKKGDASFELLPLSAPPFCTDVKSFCPTKEFCQIGQVALDHTALLKASLDWPALLTAVLPLLSKETVTNRLGNRWEFQEEAWLNDEETQLVDVIKKKLHINTV